MQSTQQQQKKKVQLTTPPVPQWGLEFGWKLSVSLGGARVQVRQGGLRRVGKRSTSSLEAARTFSRVGMSRFHRFVET